MTATEFVEQLIATASIVDIVGRHVELKKRGRECLGLCPFHNERTPSFRVYPDHYHCYGCGAHGDVIAFVMRSEGLAFPDAAMQLASEVGLADGEGLKPVDRAELERQRERRQQERALEDREEAAKQQRALDIWRDGRPIEGTPAEIYLRGRSIDPDKLLSEPAGWPETLRWSPDASTEVDGRARPALVVAVNDARTGLVTSIQRVRLHDDGRPVLGRDGKKIKLALGRFEGNAAQFSSRPDPDGRWGVGEGPETALAAIQLFQFPVWSTISSGNMPNVLPPAWARHATIFADNDDGGVIAADDARQLYAEILGAENVRVIAAERVRDDMADLLREVAA